MTRDSGKDKVGSASKSGSGVSPGDPNYQNVTDNTPSGGGQITGPLSLPASDPATTNRKTFNVMAPLTFPSSSNAASEGNGSPVAVSAPAQDASAVTTSVTPASTDVLSALASNVGQAAPRPAAVSNNFTSLASRAGAKRTLIGGA